MEYKYKIIQTPDNYDSDDIVYDSGGSGYKAKKDSKICILRCPKCLRENHAMAVRSGQCAWCGYTEEN